MKPQYLYEQHPNKKVTCPKCGKKGAFRLLYDPKTTQRLPKQYGRCDRENSCGYINLPQKNQALQFEPAANSTITQELVPQKYISNSTAGRSIKQFYKTELFAFLISRFNFCEVQRVIKQYHIGGTIDRKVIFWSIDASGNFVNGKTIKYQLIGKRDKRIKPSHLFTKTKGYYQSLFGLHLIKDSSKTIVIVESEKTALIASIIYPQFVWIASGAANGLTEDKLKPITNRSVILIPDCDKAGREGFKKGYTRLIKNGNNVTLKELDSSLNDGTDLADVILK